MVVTISCHVTYHGSSRELSPPFSGVCLIRIRVQHIPQDEKFNQICRFFQLER